MPNAFHYANTLHRIARLAGGAHPPHVRLRAALVLVDELSPNSPRRDVVSRMLLEANPFELARHKLRDLYDRADSDSPPASSGGRCHVVTEGGTPDEDRLLGEDDDPW
ncbi:MAG: hypothetical protein F4066_00650 [Chloroflexi bacterium]|nr:hypothetical protein [Chloroflexota bacterium]MYB22179.1 hypothetical protein [Chloroflexota bacterium]MYD17114.1 hypothetical protein [Chloroflexota bacterium]MYI03358.1 hypothetical protein [Chloroflexota bacterium]